VVALLATFVFLAASSVSRKSATYDETPYLGAGAYLVKTSRFDDEVTLRHPVLWTVWHDLPLLIVKIPDDIWRENSGILRGQRIIALRKDDLLLNACRLMMFPFGVALGLVIFFWSRALYGHVGGLLSLSLYCFCPNFIGHAPLVTPDVTLSCFTAFTGWRLWSMAKAPNGRNLLLAGGGLGLMLLSKHTGLLLALILFVADLTYRIAASQINWSSRKSIWSGLRHVPVVLGIGLFVVWATYGFEVGSVTLPSGFRVLSPASPYFRGAIYQYLESRQPHSFFLMGMLSNSGWWYYFLVVVLIKLPVAVLILIVGLLFARRLFGFRFCWDEIYLVVPFALLFAYLSCWNTIQNGFRYLLPVYALLFVFLGKYGEIVSRNRVVKTAVVLLVLWAMSSSVLAWPNYISYCNELIGGTRQGYHWLGDSNIDWGQDLKELKTFMNVHNIQRVQLSYFGTADPDHYGIDYEYLPSGDAPLPRTLPLPERQQSAPVMAISTYHYQGISFNEDEKSENVYRFLYRYEPNDLIGGSILIFNTQDLHLRTRPPASQRLRRLLGLERGVTTLDACP
jgi:hypothetical protein